MSDYTNVEKGLTLRRYWTNSCQNCAIKDQCSTGKERRITRWEHEHILEDVQRRLDEHPEKMRQRRETVEHPFGTIKCWMGYPDGTLAVFHGPRRLAVYEADGTSKEENEKQAA